jgi:hypothetical protein
MWDVGLGFTIDRRKNQHIFFYFVAHTHQSIISSGILVPHDISSVHGLERELDHDVDGTPKFVNLPMWELCMTTRGGGCNLPSASETLTGQIKWVLSRQILLHAQRTWNLNCSNHR